MRSRRLVAAGGAAVLYRGELGERLLAFLHRAAASTPNHRVMESAISRDGNPCFQL
ncbi:MAG TPA: hypothetical protein VLD61_11180 [Methylomirabilota bacterium]|nr:hypothetical protein [Methylomirabilota bacterium]